MTSTERETATEMRPTRQRTAVARALDSFTDFRSAQDIHALLGQRGEKVGLATVYRTLQRMAEAGDVDALRTEDGEALWRRCSATSARSFSAALSSFFCVTGQAASAWSRWSSARPAPRRAPSRLFVSRPG